MQQFQVDIDNYLYVKDEEVRYKYKHKHLVPNSSKENIENPELSLGLEEKWSKWTDLNVREFAKLNDVNIIETKKRVKK